MEKKKILTEEEKIYENAIQQENELGRLQRTYEILERGRNNKTGATNIRSAKQAKVFHIFQKEHQNILKDLTVATAPCKKQEDNRTINQLLDVLQDYNEYDGKIKTLKDYLKELDRQIYLREREVIDLESKQTSDRQCYDKVALARTTLEKLENKLEVQNKKFGWICYENRLLRDKINSFMNERTRFNQTWMKLIQNMTIGKKYMLDLIEQATIAYDQREEWVSKLNLIRHKGQTQITHFITEMRELERRKDNMTKLREFIMIKGQRRLMIDLEMKEKIRRRKQLANIELQVENYKNMMEQIHTFACEEDIEVIVKNYFQQEATNFSMFMRLIELNQEMEGLNETLFDIHEYIFGLKVMNEERSKLQASKLEQLMEVLQNDKEKTVNKQQELQEVDKLLTQIINGVENLFRVVKCDNSSFINRLGDNKKVNFFNINLFMGIIETDVQNNMAKLYQVEKNLMEKKKIRKRSMTILGDKMRTGLFTIDEIVSTSPCPLCVEHEVVHDIIDALQTVLTREEAEEKLNKRLLLPDGMDQLHNVSTCHLPKARAIMQKRYQ